MKLEEINPFVRQALVTKFDGKSHYVYNKLKCADCRLFYIISGEGEMSFDNETHKLYPGTVIILPSGTEYMWRVDTMDYYAINFDYTQNFSHLDKSLHTKNAKLVKESDILEKVVFADTTELNKPIIIYDADHLEHNFRLIITEFYVKGEFCKILTSSLLKALIIRIVCNNKNASKTKKEKSSLIIRDIIEYITANYNKDISNTKISEKFSFNPSYINRIFRMHTGTGMHEFLVNYRINAAKEMLLNNHMSVEEICTAVGFKDMPHFSKSFKKHTGKSPCEYRKHN